MEGDIDSNAGTEQIPHLQLGAGGRDRVSVPGTPGRLVSPCVRSGLSEPNELLVLVLVCVLPSAIDLVVSRRGEQQQQTFP